MSYYPKDPRLWQISHLLLPALLFCRHRSRHDTFHFWRFTVWWLEMWKQKKGKESASNMGRRLWPALPPPPSKHFPFTSCGKATPRHPSFSYSPSLMGFGFYIKSTFPTLPHSPSVPTPRGEWFEFEKWLNPQSKLQMGLCVPFTVKQGLPSKPVL